jgi:flagellar biosynthesis/type III secretory pathway protein FliH
MNNVYDDKKLQKAFDEGYEKGRAEGANITAEIEYKLSEKCCSLAEENRKLKEDFDSMESEFIRMRAQLDIVYLIFGGK